MRLISVPLIVAVKRRDYLFDIGIVLHGLVAAVWLARPLLLSPVDHMHLNHENATYAGRLLEFREQLAAGYLFPQWCTSFRGGLGSAQFCYYQPGFFHVASLMPWSLPVVRGLGATVVLFAMVGYVATYALIRPRFGRLGGWLGASSLLLSVYAGTEISIRGDLGEFAAMMLFPAVMWALAGWLEHGDLKYGAWLATTVAAMIVAHPLVSMIAFPLLAAGLAAFLLETREYRRVGAAVTMLAVGVGMAAFYWLPVALELHFVDAERATTGFYSYKKHFVDPLQLLGGYDRKKDIPFSIGTLPLLLAGFNIAICGWRHRELTVPQRRLLLFSIIAVIGLAAVMTEYSAVLWEHVGLLRWMQFPSRTLSVVTVAMAILTGASLPWRVERLRTLAAASLIAWMWMQSLDHTEWQIDVNRRVPQTIEELVQTYFAPDLRNEWLPRGAEVEIPEPYRKSPLIGPGGEVKDFRLEPRRLSCHVCTTQATTLVLPHYFFPVGWQATLAGQPLGLKSDPRGLIQFDLPADAQGRLEVVFTQTPMHRLGLILSGLSCFVGVVWLGAEVMRRRRQVLSL
jgi:hypothetical protein